ncbi:MAG: hypothetical protein ACRBM6_22100 [Geminicoccales bacterium]
MLRFVRAAALALGTVPLAAAQVLAGEYQCQQDDAALRIAVEVKKEGHTLPCEVVIEEAQNRRSVLYSASFDRDYCPQQLEKTKGELEDDGWTCQQSSVVNIVAGTGIIRSLDDLAVSPNVLPVTSDGAAITASRSCNLGDDLRRLRIEVDNPQQGKPCSLIYWSETDRSETGQQLWRAEHDSNFCTKRLDFIVEKWTDEGWQCSADDTVIQTAARSIAPVVEEVDEQVQSQANEPDNTQVAVATPTTTETSELETLAEETTEQSSLLNPRLQTIIEADAARIGEWMEVDADIEIAAYGDLNADGRDDAVVFLAYQSDQSAYRQYLMSYLDAEETYELAGVKLLTIVKSRPSEAEVEEIDEGVIWLKLVDADGTSLDPIGYQLRDQQLIQVDNNQQSRAASN